MDELERERLDQRATLIASLNLNQHAFKVTERRWRELCAKFSCPTSEERKKYARSVELYDAGMFSLDKMPSDLAASGKRMKRVLEALNAQLGLDYEKRVSIDDLVGDARREDKTIRRGTRDLQEAGLIVKTAMDAPRWRGGEGPSAFRIFWPAVRDLAIAQGWQRGLPIPGFSGSSGNVPGELVAGVETVVGRDAGQPDDGPAQDRRPEHVAGTRQPEVSAGRVQTLGGAGKGSLPPPICDHPPGQSDHPPGHNDRAPGHFRLARRAPKVRARTCASFFPLGKKELETPSSSVPIRRPAQNGEAGKKENIFQRPDWRKRRDQLSNFGVRAATVTVERAAAHGWTLEQLDAFLNRIAEMSRAGIPPWRPELICYHLQNFDPGVPIAKDPDHPAWHAEKRAAEAATARGREDAARATSERERIAHTQRESVYGPILDELIANDQAGLKRLAVESLSSLPNLLKSFERHGVTPFCRGSLLRALEERAAAGDEGTNSGIREFPKM